MPTGMAAGTACAAQSLCKMLSPDETWLLSNTWWELPSHAGEVSPGIAIVCRVRAEQDIAVCVAVLVAAFAFFLRMGGREGA